MKNSITTGIIAGICMLAVGFVLGYIVDFLFPSLSSEYANTAMYRPWTNSLMLLYFVHPFLLGIALSYLWDKVVASLRKPVSFALLFVAVAAVPGMFITYSSFQISLLMILSWTVSAFIQVLVAGFVFTKLKK